MQILIVLLLALAASGNDLGPQPQHPGSEPEMAAKELPSPGCIRAMRRIRIALEFGNSGSEMSDFEAAFDECPGRLEPLHEALVLSRIRRDKEAEQRYLALLIEHLTQEDEPIQLAALERAVVDPALEKDELKALNDRLAKAAAQPGADQRLWRAFAVAAGRVGDDIAARKALDQVLTVSPSPEVRWACIEIDRRLGNTESLVTQLEAVVAEDEVKSRIALLWLVEAYAAAGQLEKSVTTAEALAADFSENRGALAGKSWAVKALLNAAWALFDAGNDKLARVAFQRVLDIDPEQKQAETALALLYGPVEERQRYVQESERSLAESGSADDWLREGTERLAVGDAAGAFDLLHRAAEELQDNELAWYNLGLAALRLERWPEAADALDKAVALGPENPGATLNLGTACARAGRCSKALVVLNALVAEYPEMWQAHYWRWTCFSEAGDAAGAAAALEAYQRGRNGEEETE